MKYTLLFCLIFANLVQAQKPVQFDSSLSSFLNVRDFTIDKLEEEAYFTIQSPNQDISQLAKIVKVGGAWSEPTLLPFCDEFKYLEPFLSPDGKRLFFVSDRPLNRTDTLKKDFDIWYVDRVDKNSVWSSPINMGAPINTEMDEFYPVITLNNNLYFTKDSPQGYGKDDIYFSEWKSGMYQAPVILDTTINSAGYEFNAYVSPDEKFMLYTKYNEPGGMGSGDLYISKKSESGVWQKSVNLGTQINTKYMEYCPFYNSSTETLYFTGRRLDLPSRRFKSVADFQDYILNGENGLSKIYKVKLKLP